MTGVHRVMGIETEYGISLPGTPYANPMLLSNQIVNSYAAKFAPERKRARWDYDEEFPLRDARGFDISRLDADPTMLTDEDIGMANLILNNGARFYVDHAHPEYSTPEVTNPRDAVLWDKAGERIMATAARLAAEAGLGEINLYKNNTDNKGASYGTHENYLVSRATPFADIVRYLTPFFVSRQIFTGAGRVGRSQDGTISGFQISQRADFFEVEVGLETTLKRPIINTRDEPHADPELYRRLHVIVGDATMSEYATFLKMGTTSLVLAMIEEGFISEDLAIVHPVKELHQTSHNYSLKHKITLRDGRTLTALEMQRIFAETASKFVESRQGSAVDQQTQEVLTQWHRTLDDLERDPSSCQDRLDWVSKLSLLESYRQRDRLEWGDPKLELIDLQWSDVRLEKGLAYRMMERGRLSTMLEAAEIDHAIAFPPSDTRAWFRGRCVAKFPAEVMAASWDSVIFDVGSDSLQRIPTLDPLRGTQAHIGDLIEQASSAAELVASLRR